MYIHAVDTWLIYPQIQNRSHLLALSRVSRKFHFLIFLRLFEVLPIKSYDEDSPWNLELCRCLAPAQIARVPNVLTAVKKLHFRAPFEQTDLVGTKDIKRCRHIFNQDSCAFSMNSSRSQDDSHILWEHGGSIIRKGEAGSFREALFESEHKDYGLLKLAIEIAPLLSALPDNQLSSFR